MRIHFVIDRAFEGRLDEFRQSKVGETYSYWLGGQLNWACQSYLILREHREGMTLGTSPEPKVINFAHTMVWRRLGSRADEYRVSVRADYPRLFNTDFEILQNPVVPLGRRQAYLPYWPLPGILERDHARKGVRTVAYAGRIGKRNLASILKDGPRGDLAKRFGFCVIPPDRWHDMRQIDLLLAIRDFNGRTHDDKPASKLFNSWLAGVPLVGGTDSAFSAIGRPGNDYLRVTTERELSEALERLSDDPEFYETIVAAGRERRAEVSREYIAAQWLDLLEGPVVEDYLRWREDNRHRRVTSLARFVDLGRDTGTRVLSCLRARKS